MTQDRAAKLKDFRECVTGVLGNATGIILLVELIPGACGTNSISLFRFPILTDDLFPNVAKKSQCSLPEMGLQSFNLPKLPEAIRKQWLHLFEETFNCLYHPLVSMWKQAKDYQALFENEINATRWRKRPHAGRRPIIDAIGFGWAVLQCVRGAAQEMGILVIEAGAESLSFAEKDVIEFADAVSELRHYHKTDFSKPDNFLDAVDHQFSEIEELLRLHPPNGGKFTPEEVGREYREGGKPDGEILTAPHLKDSGNWCLSGSYIDKNFGPGKTLTTRIKVDRAFAYLYRELLELRDKKTANEKDERH
jgi:hypothetical protein